MKIYIQVSAQDLLKAGAPLTAIRQSYRTYDKYTEVVKTKITAGATDAYIAYESTGTSRENTHYFLPAKTAAGDEATTITTDLDDATVVWGGSIKDSYVKLAAS